MWNWLLAEILDRAGQVFAIVLKISETRITLTAKKTTDSSRRMIVIDTQTSVRRGPSPADQAVVALLIAHFNKLCDS